MKNSVNALTKTRKAQITMFILLGLALLVIFGLIYYVGSMQSRVRMQASITKMTSDILQSKALTAYTERCVQDTLENATMLLGRQGGYIYKEQQGSKIPFDIETIDYQGSKISYLILPLDRIPPSSPCYSSDNPPAYCGFIYDAEIFPELGKYNYGKNKMQKLYRNQGIYSIQSQLEHYLNTMVPKCADFTALQQQPELLQYTITEGSPSAETKFDEHAVSVILTYPIKFKVSGIPPITQLLKFTAKVDVRFRDIYEAAQDMASKDNRYLEYDIYADTKTGFFQGKGLKFIKIKKDAILSTIPISADTDIIRIEDNISLIGTDPFVFQFARKNRYPVLDYIPGVYPPKEIVDIAVLENETILIDPMARDPDEVDMTYSYLGWKQDYCELWNDATRTTSKIPVPTPPDTWQDSPEFKQTKRKAKISLTHGDAGFHNTTVQVSDLKLSDFQIVRILIELILKTRLVLDNFYPDIDNDIISIEDPYKFDATDTTWLIDPTAIYTFSWIDETIKTVLFYTIGHFQDVVKCVIHPSFFECPVDKNHDENVADMSANQLQLIHPQSRLKYEVITSGVLNQTYSEVLDLKIKECLPHGNPTHPLAYPYHEFVDRNNDGVLDFNAFGEFETERIDPFQANHTCCGSTGVIRSGQKPTIIEVPVCRPDTSIANPPADLAVEEAGGYPPKLMLRKDPIYPTFLGGQGIGLNNIYLRIFWQKCSNRGNAISGKDAKDEYWLIKDCKDPIPGEEDESCQGPALDTIFCNNLDVDPENPECVNYAPGTSFENEFLRGDKRYDGTCNENPKCSKNEFNGYGAGGPYLTTGWCNGQGECRNPNLIDMVCSKSCGAECEEVDDCSHVSKTSTCTVKSRENGYWHGEEKIQYTTEKTRTRTALDCRTQQDCACHYSSWSDPCIEIREDPYITYCYCD